MNPILASVLNPIIAAPQTSAKILKTVALINGTTIINHGLGRMMQGWIIIDVDAAATIYRSQPFNPNTLSLTSNAACTIALEVF